MSNTKLEKEMKELKKEVRKLKATVNFLSGVYSGKEFIHK
jgi:cell division protein FtsB